MIRVFIIAIALSLPSLWVHAARAQQPSQPSATAQFVGQMATLLADTIAERDAARSQLAACQNKVAQPPQAAPETKP